MDEGSPGWRGARAAILTGIALGVSAAAAPCAGALLGGASWLDVGERPPYARADAVAALGGDEAFARTRYGAALVLAGVAPVLVVSGAGAGGDDAYEMLDAAARAGVRGERVIVEPTARDTRENLVRLGELARARGWRALLVVTSAAHTRRVRLLAARLVPAVAPGLVVRVASAAEAPAPGRVEVVREYAKFLVQAVVVW